ncbi:MAG: D-aminoacylase [Abditibacteriales bacterium]|nr:D-aminoacylase [Abditibacteriales bacterium]MDW8364637.1 D-aminoacylase [Abditibacteriales bacterium]
MPFDLLIRNAQVIDGSGKPALTADIAIVGDTIAEVGKLPEEAQATEVIDATGCIVTPGFIDAHSHTDEGLLIDPTAQSKIMQGITTEVSGNCGYSPVPALTAPMQREMRERLARWGLEEVFTTMGEFFAALEQRGLGVNYASFVGHGTIRACAMGFDMRPPTDDEMRAMKRMLEQAIDEGALGLSTGLIYPPGCYADTQELIELAKILPPRGALYATHLRNEGDELIEAVAESLTIGRESGAPVQISHHKATGQRNWGKVQQTIEMMERARQQGVDVTCDQYPYIATSTSLRTLIPAWAHEGGREKLLERLATADDLEKIRAEVEQRYPTPEAWNQVMVSEVLNESLKGFEGKRLGEVAQAWGLPPFDALVKLLIEDQARTAMVNFVLCEEDVETVMRYPHTMVGTDARARRTDGPLSAGVPHPRAYGTFPRVLARYVRERQVIPLEESVRRMTSLAARRFGLQRRGLIARGYFADLVIFDPDRVTDTATYENPAQLPAGITHVLVNGVVVVRNGRHTGALTGRVLRRPGG